MEHTLTLDSVNWPACGQIIRDRRKELGISVQTLADSAGILDAEIIDSMEEGKKQSVGFASMQSLANALKLDLRSMLAGKKVPTPERQELSKQLDQIDSTIQSLSGWRDDILTRIAHLSDSRYEVRQTEERQEPVYCLYDSEKQEYVTSPDGSVVTFQDSGTAFDYCDRLNEHPEMEESIIREYQTGKEDRRSMEEKNVSESDTKEKEQSTEKEDKEETSEEEQTEEYYVPTRSAGLRI
ncbi:MAG: hypothetical protein PUE58_07285 [Lachnospiraceae bacterium]|nr:hypothetical protein [Lachnospiraceae bacterium]